MGTCKSYLTSAYRLDRAPTILAPVMGEPLAPLLPVALTCGTTLVSSPDSCPGELLWSLGLHLSSLDKHSLPASGLVKSPSSEHTASCVAFLGHQGECCFDHHLHSPWCHYASGPEVTLGAADSNAAMSKTLGEEGCPLLVCPTY